MYKKLTLNEVILHISIDIVVLWSEITGLCLLDQTAVQILISRNYISTRLHVDKNEQ